MPQKLHVVCCVGCKIFQVQIVKTSTNKWVCKVCNTKQSVLRVFGEGSGKECRILVQQLNATRGQQSEEKDVNSFGTDWAEEDFADEFEERSSELGSSQQTFASGVNVVPPVESKWSKYCGEVSENENKFLFK